MIGNVCRDLFGFAALFVAAWVIYFTIHLTLAKLRIVRGVGITTVMMAVVAAVLSGLASWVVLGGWFSSPSTYALVSITAPFSFLGFCGIYVLIGPVTVDRSITMTMLCALEESQSKKLARSQLHAEVPFDRLFEKRMRELEGSGTIDTSGEVRITPRGIRTIRAYKWLARTFNLNFQ